MQTIGKTRDTISQYCGNGLLMLLDSILESMNEYVRDGVFVFHHTHSKESFTACFKFCPHPVEKWILAK